MRFARLAARELPRRAIDARLEVQVAKPALAALGEQRALAVRREVEEQSAVLVLYQCANRHAQHDVLAAAPVFVGAAADVAVLGAVDAREPVVDQRIDVAIRDRPDAAAAAAVATRWAAARHEFLAPERGAAVAALAGVHLDLRFVDEFHGGGRRNKKALSTPIGLRAESVEY